MIVSGKAKGGTAARWAFAGIVEALLAFGATGAQERHVGLCRDAAAVAEIVVERAGAVDAVQLGPRENEDTRA